MQSMTTHALFLFHQRLDLILRNNSILSQIFLNHIGFLVFRMQSFSRIKRGAHLTRNRSHTLRDFLFRFLGGQPFLKILLDALRIDWLIFIRQRLLNLLINFREAVTAVFLRLLIEVDQALADILHVFFVQTLLGEIFILDAHGVPLIMALSALVHQFGNLNFFLAFLDMDQVHLHLLHGGTGVRGGIFFGVLLLEGGFIGGIWILAPSLQGSLLWNVLLHV